MLAEQDESVRADLVKTGGHRESWGPGQQRQINDGGSVGGGGG